MLSLLADAMFTATLARRGSDIPEHLKSHGERYVPRSQRKADRVDPALKPYRHLW